MPINSALQRKKAVSVVGPSSCGILFCFFQSHNLTCIYIHTIHYIFKIINNTHLCRTNQYINTYFLC